MYVRLFFCLIFYERNQISYNCLSKKSKILRIVSVFFLFIFSYYIFKNNDGKKPINFLFLSPLVKN